jgi:transcriptional regulator with XRE-family HTH domain
LDLLLNKDILFDLGKRIKQQRLNQNLTAKGLAERSGVSQITRTGFERSKKNISLLNFIELLHTLKLVANFGRIDSRKPFG